MDDIDFPFPFENCIYIAPSTKVKHCGTGEEGVIIAAPADNPQPAPDMYLVMYEDVVLWEQLITLQVIEWA